MASTQVERKFGWQQEKYSLAEEKLDKIYFPPPPPSLLLYIP